jgi:mycothiol synthase
MTPTNAMTPPVLRLDAAPDLPGLVFRRPRVGDASEFEAMAAVTVAGNQADGLPWVPTAELLRDELERSEGTDLASDAVIAELDGRVVAWASTERGLREGLLTIEAWGQVHPDVRRRGIGTALITENVRRARERVADEPADRPIAVQTYVDEAQVGHRIIAERLGFRPVRWFHLMHRPDLEDIPDLPLPDGLELRPVTPDQHRTIVDAEQEAFQDHWGWRELSEQDIAITFGRSQLDTGLWVVAWDGDQVAGVVQNWIWPEENEMLGVRRGWLEHISVRRPWRRRGLARAITAESLRRLKAAGMTDAMLGVDADNRQGALGLYTGLGFVPYQTSAAYRLELQGPPTSD